MRAPTARFQQLTGGTVCRPSLGRAQHGVATWTAKVPVQDLRRHPPAATQFAVAAPGLPAGELSALGALNGEIVKPEFAADDEMIPAGWVGTDHVKVRRPRPGNRLRTAGGKQIDHPQQDERQDDPTEGVRRIAHHRRLPDERRLLAAGLHPFVEAHANGGQPFLESLDNQAKFALPVNGHLVRPFVIVQRAILHNPARSRDRWGFTPPA